MTDTFHIIAVEKIVASSILPLLPLAVHRLPSTLDIASSIYDHAVDPTMHLSPARYLSDVEEGGETVFPRAGGRTGHVDYSDCSKGLKVQPRRG